MSEEQTAALSLRAAYAFGATRGLESEVVAIRDMVIEWDSPYTSSLRRGYIVDLFEKNGIFNDFKANHWTLGNTRTGETLVRRYQRIKQQYEDFLAGRGPEIDGDNSAERPDEDQQFAAESDLRDFLARNPGRIESGL